MYLGPGWSLGTNDHLVAVGKSAPPRPRSPEAFTSSITCAAFISVTTLRSAEYPPRPSYTSSLWRLALPNHSVSTGPPTVPRFSANLLDPWRGPLARSRPRGIGCGPADLLDVLAHQAAVVDQRVDLRACQIDFIPVVEPA